MRFKEFFFTALSSSFILATSLAAAEFKSNWNDAHDRQWVGADSWANRLQDWQLIDGKLNCVVNEPRFAMRSVHLTTYRVEGEVSGDLQASVKMTLPTKTNNKTSAGLLIGAGSELDYRAASIIHHNPGPGAGLLVGVRANGTLFINDRETGKNLKAVKIDLAKEISLSLSAKDLKNGNYLLTAKVGSTEVSAEVNSQRLAGNVGLMAHPGSKITQGFTSFDQWQCQGDMLKAFPERNSGPILSNQYTLSKGIMKMTAQMLPISKRDNQLVELQLKENGSWKTIAQSKVDPWGYTARFRVEGWNSTIDSHYRLRYELVNKKSSREYTLSGTVRRDPKDKKDIKVAGFTGNHNMAWGIGSKRHYQWTKQKMWYPHDEMYDKVAYHKPDVLFFSGDQVYENASPTGADVRPEHIHHDYLYKWYLWCYATRHLTKDIPCVTITDDHDVFQGNIWGCGGRSAKGQNDGGYVMSADMVKAVERTQASHLPDAFDPRPIDRGIGVYYTDMLYGGISFAILEDRKFKTQPAGIVPPTDTHRPDHVKDQNFDASVADVPAARLLGERQLYFLDQWGQDWRGASMKSVLTQSIFAAICTHHGGMNEAHRLKVDYDSNGWPQTGRNKALAKIRKCYAFSLGGDQHLGSIVKHGIDEHGDAGWAFTVPSIANYYPRSWKPLEQGISNRMAGMPYYTGDHKDGFGNRITVWAVNNPGSLKTIPEPKILNSGMAGYGIVTFNKEKGDITMACWPRFADPADDKQQYKGWPKTVNHLDNYGKKAAAYLPTIKVKGMERPVIQVIDESTSEILYTIRSRSNSFRPKVFKEGRYMLKVGELKTEKVKVFKGVKSLSSGEEKVLEVTL